MDGEFNLFAIGLGGGRGDEWMRDFKIIWGDWGFRWGGGRGI